MDPIQLAKAKEEVRLTQLEIDSKIIRSDINQLKNNHLKHIEKSMDNMDKRIEKLDTRVWAILFSIVCLAASNVMSAFFG
jgi:hypothetical protein